MGEDYKCHSIEIIFIAILVARVDNTCCLLITDGIILRYRDYPYNCKLMSFITATPVINADNNFLFKVKHKVK